MRFLAAHHLAWTQHPAIWLCESCAILWLVIRFVRSSARSPLHALRTHAECAVVEANAGRMPVVGMPDSLHPVNSTCEAATPTTRLPFLGDQARLGLFSVGDIVSSLVPGSS